MKGRALPAVSQAAAAADGSAATTAVQRTTPQLELDCNMFGYRSPQVARKGSFEPARTSPWAWYAVPEAPSDGSNLLYALRYARNGDSIILSAGKFVVPAAIMFAGRHIALRGAGAGKSVLVRGDTSDRVFILQRGGHLRLEDMTIDNACAVKEFMWLNEGSRADMVRVHTDRFTDGGLA